MHSIANNKEKRFGRYRIIEEIGRGGMGKVFKAQDEQLQRIVALKILNRSTLNVNEGIERFLREGRMMAKLHHPNIAIIYDMGHENEQPFLAMEFITGQSLKQYIKSGSANIPIIVKIMSKICDAVHYAHLQGVVHRDLKPGNVLLDVNLEPKVLDFGLAKSLEGQSDLSQDGQILGTIKYMSPEQANGDLEKIDAVSDVYSLGAVLYELLTGRAPFAEGSVANLFYQILNQEVEPPSKFNSKIPKELDRVCLKALSKNKDTRYQNAELFRRDLTRYNKRPVQRNSRRRTQKKKTSVSHWIIAGCVTLSFTLLIIYFSFPNKKTRNRQQVQGNNKQVVKYTDTRQNNGRDLSDNNESNTQIKDDKKAIEKRKDLQENEFSRIVVDVAANFAQNLNLNKVAISGNGKYVAFGSEGINSIIFAQTDGKTLWKNELPDDNSPYDKIATTESIAISENGELVVVGSQQLSLVAFSKEGKMLWRKAMELGEWQVTIVDDKVYAAAGNNLLCFTTESQLLWEKQINVRQETIWGICVAKNDKRIFLQTNSDVIVLDQNGVEQKFFDIVKGNHLISMGVSSDGTHFAALFTENNTLFVALYNVKRSEEIWRDVVHGYGSVAVDDYYRVLYSGNRNCLWDAKGQVLCLWGSGANSLDISDDGKYIVTGSQGYGGMVYILKRE